MSNNPKMMTARELGALGKIFDAFEKTFDADVTAEMFDYDNERVDLKVTDGNGDDICFWMPREYLLKDISMDKKLERIK